MGKSRRDLPIAGIVMAFTMIVILSALRRSEKSVKAHHTALQSVHRHVLPTVIPDIVVPNIVHYIWYRDLDSTFTFYQYLSVLSVHKFQKPEAIYFYTNRPPLGEYWEKCLKIPHFYVISRERPKKVLGVEVDKGAFKTSDANLGRVKILMEQGGIYLDTDVLLIKSLDPLRKYEFVLGEEKADPLLLCSSIILANKKAPFLKLWMEHYLMDRQVKNWGYNSGKVPTVISKRYPDLIHIVQEHFQHPSWSELDYLYGMKAYPWREHYTLHLWHSVLSVHDPKKMDISPDTIKTLNSTYGQVARHIYYK